MKIGPLALAFVFFGVVVWGFIEILTLADATSKMIYALLITSFLPLGSRFLNASGILGNFGSKTGAKGKSYPCSKCGAPFEAIPYDDSLTFASRTKGEYSEQAPMTYLCRKCKTRNIIYWSNPLVTIYGRSEGD